MGVRTLFSGQLSVHYGQAYVESAGETPDMRLAFGGQSNGLCGAAVRGGLFLIIATHTGRVAFAVEVHDVPPPVEAEWEEVVEASFTPASPQVILAEWGGGTGEGPWLLDLPEGSWRVRYCAVGMDDADGPPRAGDKPVERYLLMFWPAPPGADQVVRQTSDRAAYWHAQAQRQPPPPPPTAEGLAQAELRARQARETAREQLEVEMYWGGRAPSDRLRSLGGSAIGVARRDRDLVDLLDQADPAVQRTIAVWVARQASELAGLASLDWVAPALDALEQGNPLPEPFDHLPDAFERLRGSDRGRTRATLTIIRADKPPPERRPRIDPRYAALPAIPAAAHPDPLRGALDALQAATATFADDDQRLLDDLRHTFSSQL